MKHCIVIITHNHRFAYRNEQRHYTSEQAATVWALSETARFGSFHPVHEDIKGAHTGFLFNKLQSKWEPDGLWAQVNNEMCSVWPCNHSAH